jgi:hypothetical protein
LNPFATQAFNPEPAAKAMVASALVRIPSVIAGEVAAFTAAFAAGSGLNEIVSL